MYLVPAVAVIALIMWLLRRLVRKGNFLRGALVILGTGILITAAGFLFVKTTSTSIQGLIECNVELQERGVTAAEIKVAQDGKTNEIYGFGPLIVSDDDGNRYIPLTFDAEGNLTGPPEALAYAGPIHKTVVDLPGKAVLTGSSLTWNEMQAVIDAKLTTEHEIFSWDAVVMTTVQWNTVTLFLAIYFIALIFRKRKKDRVASKQTEIRDL